jgi:putative ABC transport system permease protein
MQPAWRLAINSLSGRRSRSLLLAAAVAMSAALITAVACAMASLDRAIEVRIATTVGAADIRLRHVGTGSFDAGVAELVRGWEEVALAVPRAKESIALANPRTGKSHPIVAYGIDPALEKQVRPFELMSGRLVERDGEILLDSRAAEFLGAVVGDRLRVEMFGDPVELGVVGVVRPPPLSGIIEREEGFLTLATLMPAVGKQGRIGEVDILVRPGVNPTEASERRREQVPAGLILQATEKITSGLAKNQQSNRVGFILSSVLAFLAAAFIIMTGLTTNITERTRELAVLRCVGATRGQLAGSQLIVGALVGFAGACAGIPLGLAGTLALVKVFHEQLPSGFAFSGLGVVLAMVGATGAGVAGAVWPAVAAARVSPLEGLSVRSRNVGRRWLWVCSVGGLALAGVHALTISLPLPGDVVFWCYVLLGVPSLMTGYFLLGVPVTLVVCAALAGVLTRVLGLPGAMLARTVRATPYRHGFTAGAMMLGLAMMVSIWTNGTSIMRDWLTALKLPDGFVYGLNFKPEVQGRIAALDEVAQTCAITIQTVGVDKSQAMGVAGLSKFGSSFVGFEPEPFFAMTKVTWIQGDEATAIAELKKGDAILVSREFLNTRNIGVGSTMTLKHNGKDFTFRVVGVITSPGLDIASQFLEVGDRYLDQSVNSVFGTREDLIKKFGNDSINFVQVAFKPGKGTPEAMARVKQAVGPGVLIAVLATEMKAKIEEFIGASLAVASAVAIGAMLVACLGVANLIIAGIQARQFEFGVLRAVGAQRGLLARLVMGEALLIAIVACVLGTLMGLQGSWAGLQLYRLMIGLVLSLQPPLEAIALGCGAVVAITLGAAAPAVWRLAQRKPRELLAAMKG